MIDFTEETAISVAKKALASVADFNPSSDIKKFNFSQFNEFHRKVFITNLKNEVLNVKDDNYFYDIPLNPTDINNWPLMADCIEYLMDYNALTKASTERIVLR